MISVVVCNYNYGLFLKECIESLLNQNFSYPYEIIIVDDGSSDNSREVLAAYDSVKIKTVYQENSGQFAAFARGVREARYNIVCFCDSDDTFTSEKLEVICNYFQNYPDVGLIQHRARIFGNNELEGRLHPLTKEMEENIFYPKMRSFEDGIAHSTIASCLNFRKSVIEKLSLGNSVLWNHKHYGDIPFRAIGLLCAPSIYITEVLTNYRVHDSSHHLTNINKSATGNKTMQRLIIEHFYVLINEFLNSMGEEQISLYENPKWQMLARKAGGVNALKIYDEFLSIKRSWAWKIITPLYYLEKFIRLSVFKSALYLSKNVFKKHRKSG